MAYSEWCPVPGQKAPSAGPQLQFGVVNNSYDPRKVVVDCGWTGASGKALGSFTFTDEVPALDVRLGNTCISSNPRIADVSCHIVSATPILDRTTELPTIFGETIGCPTPEILEKASRLYAGTPLGPSAEKGGCHLLFDKTPVSIRPEPPVYRDHSGCLHVPGKEASPPIACVPQPTGWSGIIFMLCVADSIPPRTCYWVYRTNLQGDLHVRETRR